eukprot:jgi/Psemu1/44313/gm1.44313_g
MPPISDAALSGISVFEAAIAPRMARCTKIGISSTSTGVLLTPIDRRKVITNENSSPSWRLILNNRSRNRAAGSSAPRADRDQRVMAETGEGEAQPVGRLGVRQREEIQPDRNHRDRHQRDDLDRHAPAREGNEHRDGNAHRGDCMVGRNPDHPTAEIPVYPAIRKDLVWYPWPDSNRHFKETRF